MNLPADPRHQRFADLRLEGQTLAQAYVGAGYKGDRRSSSNASKIEARDDVKAYMAAAREKLAASTEISREEVARFLAAVIRTPVGDVDPSSHLCQEFSESPEGTKVKMPGKLGAAKQLADMFGWNKPQEVKVSASDQLADILARIRRQ